MKALRPFLVRGINACAEAQDHSEYSVFRKHTLALLRHYFRLSMEHGRVPSVLGGGSMRAKVSHHRAYTLEDETILLLDMERCMTRELNACELKLVALTVFMDLTFEESARSMSMNERHLRRIYPDALNRLTRAFGESGFLNIPELRRHEKKPMGRVTVGEMKANAASIERR